MGMPKELRRVGEAVWELPIGFREGMRVPVRVFGSEELAREMDDAVFQQAANVATLPGIVGYSYVMPDAHWGYGFPIGGVAAMDPRNGVISPGGIGFDINCGMRLVRTDLTFDEVEPHLHRLVDRLYERVPAGVGSRGFVQIDQDEFREVAEQGARWCLRRGMAIPVDLEHSEEGGCLSGADASTVSKKAVKRGYHQIGTLGSGNHYLEIQVVRPENVFDAPLARRFGISRPNQVMVMFHCGSRGFGHQVASDALQVFLEAMPKKFGIPIIDRQLACAPFSSREGQEYFSAMKCAANMSFANRQVILHRIREVFEEVFGRDPVADLGLHVVYDVAHNMAKLETHEIDGQRRELLVHRKGATRAFAPGSRELPADYRDIGQPVIIGGSMETGSYLLVGERSGRAAFFSTAHGSGRIMSRSRAKKLFKGRDLQQSMEHRGIYVRSVSHRGLAEEAGGAYKNIDDVVASTDRAGLSHPVVRLLPIGNVKG